MEDYSSTYLNYNDVILNNGKLIFEQQLNGLEGKDVLIDNTIKTKALIQYHSNPLNESVEDRKLTVWRDIDITSGSLVKILEEDNEYLVITKVKQNDLVKYTKILLCNNTLTFDDLNISYPCVIKSNVSMYQKIDDRNFVSLPNDIVNILVPFNSNTKNIKHKQKFIFNDRTYEVQVVDAISNVYKNNGTVNILLKIAPISKSTDIDEDEDTKEGGLW